ncbi:Uma2 family endonuclease [Sorangium sp. So ce1036]|uniref:Uma2 family endonuclease n=1 Tax=Sorangium sp. So ce1036 TaxID=3133328 RepID=UPI003F00656B
MNAPARKLTFTYADYLAQERASSTKHEFLHGEIFAMAGGTPEHARLAAQVIAELAAQLRRRPCAVFSSDLRVRVLATGLATYPDVAVVCGRLSRDPEDDDAVVNPVVLVEVLSDSTEAYDRGEKFAHYRRIPSLKEYVLVSQQHRRIEVFRRNEDSTWTLHEAGPGASARLTSVGCELAVNDVYDGALETSAAG